eukprot:41503_1
MQELDHTWFTFFCVHFATVLAGKSNKNFFIIKHPITMVEHCLTPLTLDLFVNQTLASEYICGICMEILRNPTDINCGNGHLFCGSCLRQLYLSYDQSNSNANRIILNEILTPLSSTPSVDEFVSDFIIPCPVCKQSTRESNYHESQFTERQIGKLLVFCVNRRIATRSRSPSLQRTTNNYNTNNDEATTPDIDSISNVNSPDHDVSDNVPRMFPFQIVTTPRRPRARTRAGSVNASVRPQSRSRSRDRTSRTQPRNTTHAMDTDRNDIIHLIDDETDHKSHNTSGNRDSDSNHNHNNGCSWKGELIDLRCHLVNECEFHLIECEFCGNKVLQHNMAIHHEFECLDIKLNCRNDGCLHRIRRRLMDYHCSHQCEHRVVNCVNSECDARVSLFNLSDHLDECQENPTRCEYFKYGCTSNIKRKHKELHNKNFEAKHVKLKVNALERMLTDKSEQIDDLKFEISDLGKKYDELKSDMNVMSSKFNQIINSVCNTLILHR